MPVINGGSGPDTLTGGDGNDALSGGDGADILDGAYGNDLLDGGAGDDVAVFYGYNPAADYTVDLIIAGAQDTGNGLDTLISIENLTVGFSYTRFTLRGDDGANALTTASGSDLLEGRGGDDRLSGGQDDDLLYGGSGDDILSGGQGSDYHDGGDGFDTAVFSGDRALYSILIREHGVSVSTRDDNDVLIDVERIQFADQVVWLVPAPSIVFTGDDGDDEIAGGAGKDSLSGGAGADTLNGYEDDDILNGDAGADRLYGGFGMDRLNGGVDSDILDGGGGVDVMTGGAGDDVYYVDNAADQALEIDGEGIDIVLAFGSYSLSNRSWVERLTLIGPYAADATGNNIANVITGNDAENVIDGRKGADTMIGGGGSDTYYVDNAHDVIVEANRPYDHDTAYASVSYTLSNTSFIETLWLTGSGNINAVGNNIDNTLVGNAGNNVINGRKGADTMMGGLGNDTYYVDNVADRVIEGEDAGTDTVITTVSYALSNTSFVEGLTLAGTANLDATGNNIGNVIVGNGGSNRIDGRRGGDVMTGGGGADVFTWGAISDSKLHSADRITDLGSDDILDLSRIDANTNLADDQAFVLAAAFTGTAGQAVLSFNAGTGLTSLSLDVNGDGVADMLIRMNGDHSTFTHFIL